MHLLSILEELGPFTVLSQLHALEYQSIDNELKNYFPLCDQKTCINILENTQKEILNIPDIKSKESIIISGPELILLEVFEQLGLQAKIYVAIDSKMSSDVLDRVSRNVPHGLSVEFLQIPNFPGLLKENNSLMIVASFPDSAKKVWVTKATHLIIRYYRQYYEGNICFIHPQTNGFDKEKFSSKWKKIDKGLFVTKTKI